MLKFSDLMSAVFWCGFATLIFISPGFGQSRPDRALGYFDLHQALNFDSDSEEGRAFLNRRIALSRDETRLLRAIELLKPQRFLRSRRGRRAPVIIPDLEPLSFEAVGTSIELLDEYAVLLGNADRGPLYDVRMLRGTYKALTAKLLAALHANESLVYGNFLFRQYDQVGEKQVEYYPKPDYFRRQRQRFFEKFLGSAGKEVRAAAVLAAGLSLPNFVGKETKDVLESVTVYVRNSPPGLSREERRAVETFIARVRKFEVRTESVEEPLEILEAAIRGEAIDDPTLAVEPEPETEIEKSADEELTPELAIVRAPKLAELAAPPTEAPVEPLAVPAEMSSSLSEAGSPPLDLFSEVLAELSESMLMTISETFARTLEKKSEPRPEEIELGLKMVESCIQRSVQGTFPELLDRAAVILHVIADPMLSERAVTSPALRERARAASRSVCREQLRRWGEKKE